LCSSPGNVCVGNNYGLTCKCGNQSTCITSQYCSNKTLNGTCSSPGTTCNGTNYGNVCKCGSSKTCIISE